MKIIMPRKDGENGLSAPDWLIERHPIATLMGESNLHQSPASLPGW
jgi:hypothetical protein